MKKLIELDAAVSALDGLPMDYGRLDVDDVLHALASVPTVDAVPVVRCKDCRYFRCNMRGDGTLPNGVCVLLWRGGYDPMDFCSEGERKDGNSNG